MFRWYGTLLLAVVFTAHSCDGNDSNRTEVLNIGETLTLSEKTNYACFSVNTSGPAALRRTITSTNDGGLYRCFDINNQKDPMEPTAHYVMVFIRHEVSSVIASGDICADNSSSNLWCLTIEEGTSTTLWCNATDGYPTPIVRWFIREFNKMGYKDTDLGIEGQLIIHNISYECTSLLVCKVGNYINKEKESTVEKLIKVYVGRQPNAAIETLKDGKLQNSGTNISICPRDGMVFSCNVMNTSPPPDVVIIWNMSDIYILTWNFTLNSGWNTAAYFTSDVSITCKTKFDSIIQHDKNPLNATIEWKNIDLDCVSYIKCEAANMFGKDIKTLNLMKGQCQD
ncbi:uncharacterized protein LOC128176623 [Crassostrea angulata]|uniref:uncharacterized protein LOC128176623 n=1 Tax=Magallana angulata TaxID=2784310 RepID=UPI0022B08DB2|nr:uncharacterized protein LOC128176623 [Crassostrea angulata]